MILNTLEGFICIKGFEGYYSLNDNGDVLSDKRRVLLRRRGPSKSSVTLSKNGEKKCFSVSSLVVEHFSDISLKNKRNLVFDYIDGNSHNKNIKNIRIVKRSPFKKNYKDNLFKKRVLNNLDKICFFSIRSAAKFYKKEPISIKYKCKNKIKGFQFI